VAAKKTLVSWEDSKDRKSKGREGKNKVGKKNPDFEVRTDG